MKITYYLEVISSWCYWAEPAWAELQRRYAGRVQFDWQIAQMPAAAYPPTQADSEWYYRRSGTVMRSPFMLNAGWFEPEIQQYVVPNLVAEAAKDFGVTDDRVRLALAEAALRQGRRVGRWDEAVAIAAAAGGLAAEALRERAQSAGVAERVRVSSAAFAALQIDQRPGFLLQSPIGDRAVFSGLARIEPLAATLDAMLADAAAYTSFAAHFGSRPPAAAAA